MLRAAIGEIRNTPIAAAGAVAGIVSCAIAVFMLTGAVSLPASPRAVSWVPLVLLEVALSVPATAFFFAYVAIILFKLNELRGVFAGFLAYLIGAVFVGAVVGAILHGQPTIVVDDLVVPSSTAANPNPEAYLVKRQVILGIDIAALSILSNFAMLLTFVVAGFETAIQRWKLAKREHDKILAKVTPERRREYRYGQYHWFPDANAIRTKWHWIVGLTIGAGVTLFVLGSFVIHSCVRAVLFPPV